jgi:hypothetical protein
LAGVRIIFKAAGDAFGNGVDVGGIVERAYSVALA